MKIDALREKKSWIMGQVGDRVAESGGFDPCLLSNIQTGVLMEEKQGYATALKQLMSELLSEHRNVLDYVKGLQEQRVNSNQEIRAKTVWQVLLSLKETFEGGETGSPARAHIGRICNGSCRLYHKLRCS